MHLLARLLGRYYSAEAKQARQTCGGEMSSIAIHADVTRWQWLRSSQFDLTFILGLPALGIATGCIVTWRPEWFVPILIVDFWFLGYHHVISTYTRLCFDRKSLAESRLLIFGLLPLVAVVTIALVGVVGVWAIVSVYFYWQWFHYTRQSWGISRMYRGKDREAFYEDGWIDQAIFYALPVLGILYRSYQDPGKFIGLICRSFRLAVACGNSGRFDGGFARILDFAPHPSLVASAARCSAYALHGEPLRYLRRRLSHD